MNPVADTQFTLRGAPAALIVLLAAARAQGAGITRTKAAKLLYLADLRAIETLGRPGSRVQWRWLNYGPFSYSLLSIEDDLVRAGIIGRETSENFYGSPVHRLRLERPVSVDVDEEFADIVEQIVSEYGHLAASSLRDVTYQTAPMLEAQRDHARGQPLDLLSGRPVPDLTSALHRFQGVLDRLEPQADEGDLEGLADDVASWAPERARATEPFLDDD